MKRELLNSISVAIDRMENISVCGRNNVYCVADTFQILEGMSKYISQLPDEAEENDE